MKKKDVVVHKENNLQYLLCGKQPEIKSRIAKQNDSSTLPKIDISHFPQPVQDFGDKSHTSRDYNERGPFVPIDAKNYNFIKNTQRDFSDIDENLKKHEDSYNRKKVLMHQEWEEQYVAQLTNRMQKKLHGRPYTAYKNKRKRAITALETQSRDDISIDDDYTPPPSLKIPVSNIRDRVHQYQKNSEKERKLKKIVGECNGEVENQPPNYERNAIDSKAWKTLPKTRFFGADDFNPPHVGLKVFPQKYKSVIEDVLNQF